MFTGIIECQGEVQNIEIHGSNKVFTIFSPITNELKVDQSVAHNGVCLTVVEINGNSYKVDVIEESLNRSALGSLQIGDKLNIERCMIMNGRLDGHIVQGHVDQTGTVSSIKEENGSWRFSIDYDGSQGNITVEKGSICINGVSLTVIDSNPGMLSVAIIPFTYENTGFNQLQIGDKVNLEFDIIGKYISRLTKGYS